MKQYKYELERTSKKYICPECGRKTFVRYVFTGSGQYIHSSVGKCDRIINCEYHFPPREYFRSHKINDRDIQPIKNSTVTIIRHQASYIPTDIFYKSFAGYEHNKFVQFLLSVFDVDIVRNALEKYHIGTSNLWNGATIFWQVDIKGMIRTGKIILFDPQIGKRIKCPRNCISWVHSALSIPNFTLNQCLFGEHLLVDRLKPVAVVEAEKTAIIASLYFPNFIWLATGGLSNLTAARCEVLHSRNVTLFPDLDCYEKWSTAAEKLLQIARFKVSNLLECNSTNDEKKAGLDIADYLLNFSPKIFKGG